MKEVIAYTDGSAVVSGENKGKGGFGIYFPNLPTSPKGFSKGYEETKTGRMELSALYYAIKATSEVFKEPITLKIYSDSQYVVKAFTERRLEKWVSNNWINSSGDVKNQDLWLAILNLLSKHKHIKLEMNWIKGHQVDKEKNPVAKAYLMQDNHIVGNMMADRLANRWRLGNLEKTDKL